MSLDSIVDAYALTPLQQGMLYHVLAEPASDVYMAYVTMDIHGPLSIERMQFAWQQAYARHDALRTAFVWDGLDKPLQVVHESVSLSWTIDSNCASKQQTRGSYLEACLADERRSPFDIAQAPLTRLRVLQWSETEHTLIWVVHHLLADDWSTPIVLRDVMEFYNAAQQQRDAELPDEFRFANHVHWLAENNTDAAIDHWRTYLTGRQPTPVNAINEMQPRSIDAAPTVGGVKQINKQLSDALSAQISNLCKQHSLTLSTVAHSLWGIAIAAYADTHSALIGSNVAGRMSGQHNIDNAVGLFLNTIPVAVDLDSQTPLIQWLADLQQQMQSHLQYEHVALSELQQFIQHAPGETVLESVVVVESHGKDLRMDTADADVAIDNIDYLTISNFPLTLLVFPGDTLSLRIAYDSSRFSDALTHQLLIDLQKLFERLAQPDVQQNTSIDLLGSLQQDYQAQAYRYGDTSLALAHTSVAAWFEHTCANSPDADAVEFGGTTTSYSELAKKANQIANALHAAGVPAGEIIGLYIERSLDQIAAMLGILAAGCAYLPLDPAYPAKRIEQLINNARITHVVCNEHSKASLPDSAQAALTALTTEHCRNFSIQPCTLVAAGDICPNVSDLAYVLYTSGSTGEPKGVKVTHANLMYSTAARIAYYGNAKPRFVMLSSLSFDSSVAGLFWSLCGGGTLILPDPEQEKDMAALGRLMQRDRPDTTLCLPSLYQLMLEYIDPAERASLSTVIVAGENCQASVTRQHAQHQAHATLYNEYGPTEATVWSSVYRINATHENGVPIGKPIGNSLIAVLNQHGKPCAPATLGEIHIGGSGVADGYLHNVDQTDKVFITNPVNNPNYPTLYRSGDLGYWSVTGELIIAGRADRQMKIRGHRIEPSEIEQVLCAHPMIADAVITTNAQVDMSGELVSSTVELLNELPADEAEELLAQIEAAARIASG